MKTVYFDNAATTKLDEKVLESMMPYFGENSHLTAKLQM